MKAFTIWQPWASLVIVGAKPWEFRGRSFLRYPNAPRPGERIGIHAGMRPIRPKEVEDLLARLGRKHDHTGLKLVPARQVLERVRAAYKCQALPLGAVLGTAVIGTPVLSCDLFNIPVADSDRGRFNYAWPLTDVERFDVPITMRGAQGSFHFAEKLAA
jgi:hypothetical protein